MRFICAGLLALTVSCASAKEIPTLTIITGTENSTYHWMFNDLQKICKDVVSLQESNTTIDGINLFSFIPRSFNVSDKKSSHGDLTFIISPMLLSYNNWETLDKERKEDIKILMPLNYEEILMFVKKNNKVSLQKIEKLGVMHRSIMLGKFFKDLLNAKYKTLPFYNRKEAFQNLKTAKIDALLILENEDAHWIKKLKGFSIISIPYFSKDRSDRYKRKKINFPNLTKKPISTLAVQNLLITKNISDPRGKQVRLNYRSCILHNLERLQSLPSMHPEWKDVDVENYKSLIYK